MDELTDPIRKVFDHHAPPIDVASIPETTRRRAARTWASVTVTVVGVSTAILVAVWLRTGDTTSPGPGDQLPAATVDQSPTTTTRIAEPQSTVAPKYLGEVVYLSLDREGWSFAGAAEGSDWCTPFRTQTSWFKADADGRPLMHLNLNTAALDPACGPVPTRAADLGPPISPPGVIDLGETVVLGQPARVIESSPRVIVVQWLWDSGAGKGEIALIPYTNDPILSEAMALIESIVELSPAEWAALLATAPTPTTPDW